MVNIVVGVIDRPPVGGRDRLAPSAELFELKRVINDVEEILRPEQWVLQALALWTDHLDAEFETADAREVEFARVEEHPVKERLGGLQRRRIGRAHLAIDFDQRLLG